MFGASRTEDNLLYMITDAAELKLANRLPPMQWYWGLCLQHHACCHDACMQRQCSHAALCQAEAVHWNFHNVTHCETSTSQRHSALAELWQTLVTWPKP